VSHRVHEADALSYGTCLDMYLKHKNKYKMCVFYEDLVKNPMVKNDTNVLCPTTEKLA
jgi:hypothetical protein